MTRGKAVAAVLAVVVLLAAVCVVLPGFMKRGDVYIGDYSLSADGAALTVHVGVASSAGYVRKVSVAQQSGGKLYLDCYGAFGGVNGAWGAKSQYTIPLSADTETVAFYRASGCYEPVLVKDSAGVWQRAKAN